MGGPGVRIRGGYTFPKFIRSGFLVLERWPSASFCVWVKGSRRPSWLQVKGMDTQEEVHEESAPVATEGGKEVRQLECGDEARSVADSGLRGRQGTPGERMRGE